MAKKDLGAIWQRKGIRALLMLMPVILLVVIPLVYSAATSLLPVTEDAQVPEAIQSLLESASAELGYRQIWFDAFTTLLCPMLFLTVPVICSVASASYAFLGEKEEGTLETVLLSSMDAKSVFNSKVSSCSLLSVVISLLSFLAFAITVSVADLILGAPFFFNWKWLILLLFLMPALAFFSVIFVSLVISRVHSTGESLQTMGYLILPFVILFLVQFTGIIKINAVFLLILSVLLAVASVVMFNVSARRFYAERLLERPLED
mgnify:FL=1